VVLAAIGAAVGDSSKTPADPGSTSKPTYEGLVVTYLLTGSARSASITYTNSSGNVEQSTNVAVPLTSHDASGSSHDGLIIYPHHGAFVSILAQNNGDSGDLACSILYNGTVINTGHASGGYAIATCSATVP
jgi:hypothetical protein